MANKYITPGEKDLWVEISQYGTDPGSADFAERAFIFGSQDFRLKSNQIQNLEFVVKNGIRSINNINVTVDVDNFDFESGFPPAMAFNEFIGKPTVDPYGLTGEFPGDRVRDVLINFVGQEGRVYKEEYTSEQYLLDKNESEHVDRGVSFYKSLETAWRDVRGMAVLAQEQNRQYFLDIANDPFLSYMHDGRKVVYGTTESETLTYNRAEVSSDIYPKRLRFRCKPLI